MPPPRKNTSDILNHPAFVGVSDAESAKIIDAGMIHSLAAGDSFLKAFSPSSIFLIASGAFSLRYNREQIRSELAIPAGNWFGECAASEDFIAKISFLRPHRINLDMLAAAPTVLLSIPEQKLKTMAFQDQIKFIKNLDRSSQQMIETLILDGMVMENRSKRLTDYIVSHLWQRDAEYEKSAIVQSILEKYPRLPLYATKLMTMLKGDHASAGEIVEAAKLDPSLAGLILRVANSPYYNLPQKITDFQHAILLLGFNQIYHMLIDAGVQTVMPKTNDFHKLRFDSVLLSFITFELASASSAIKPVTASTLGLLYCIGRSVILLLKKQHPASAILFDGLDHGKLGALLLQAWNLPDTICSAIKYQSVPEYAAPEAIPLSCRSSAAILYLSRLCCSYLEGVEALDLHTTFLTDYQKHLGFAPLPVPDFARKYVKPGILKKTAAFPDNVRKFLVAVEPRWA